MTTEFAYLPVASSLHDEAALDRLVAGFDRSLEDIDGRRISAGELDVDLPLVFLTLTGGTERRLLDLWATRQGLVPGEPAHLIAHPAQNALPAAMEALARLHQLGARGRILMVRGPTDADGFVRVRDAVHGLAVWRFLHAARIGLVGGPSDWLVASSPSGEDVRRTWGPSIVQMDIEQVVRRFEEVPAASIQALAGTFSRGAAEMVEPGRHDVREAARMYPALRDLFDRERLDALSVRCFDLLAKAHTSSCLAFAELNDEGLLTGCEGDLVSTVAMLWLGQLTSQMPWMANPAYVDVDLGTVRLAHCTVPRSLAGSYRLRTHFESGIGVGISGDMPLGNVTLVRVGGVYMDQLWVSDGESLPIEVREDLYRTQMEVRLHGTRVGELLERPLGNHIVSIRGHHAARIEEWWRTMIAPVAPVG